MQEFLGIRQHRSAEVLKLSSRSGRWSGDESFKNEENVDVPDGRIADDIGEQGKGLDEARVAYRRRESEGDMEVVGFDIGDITARRQHGDPHPVETARSLLNESETMQRVHEYRIARR